MTAERSFEWMAVATLPRAMSKSLMRLRSSPMSPKSPSLWCVSGHGIIWHALTPRYLNIIVSWPVAQPHSRIWLLTSHRIQIFQTFDRQSKQQWNSTNQWKIHFGNTFFGTNQNNWHPIKLNNQWRGCAMGSRDSGNIWVPIFETRIFAQVTPCQVWRHHSFSISDLIWRPPQPSCLTA